jgi:hypothetical protein
MKFYPHYLHMLPWRAQDNYIMTLGFASLCIIILSTESTNKMQQILKVLVV